MKRIVVDCDVDPRLLLWQCFGIATAELEEAEEMVGMLGLFETRWTYDEENGISYITKYYIY